MEENTQRTQRIQRILRFLTPFGTFLLKGAGWTAVGIVTGFIVSYFFKVPGRVDTFAITETLLGVIVTGLSIVAAFIVSFQWSNLESKMNAFDIKVKDTQVIHDRLAQDLVRISTEAKEKITTSIDSFVKERADFSKEKEEYMTEINNTIARLEKIVQSLHNETKSEGKS